MSWAPQCVRPAQAMRGPLREAFTVDVPLDSRGTRQAGGAARLAWRGRTRVAWALRRARRVPWASMRRWQALLTAQRAHQVRMCPCLGAWRSRRVSAPRGTRGATADRVKDVGRGRTRKRLIVQRVRRVLRVRSRVVPAPVPARVAGRIPHQWREALHRATVAALRASGGMLLAGKSAPRVLLGRTRTLVVLRSALRAQKKPLSRFRGVPRWGTASRQFLPSHSR